MSGRQRRRESTASVGSIRAGAVGAAVAAAVLFAAAPAARGKDVSPRLLLSRAAPAAPARKVTLSPRRIPRTTSLGDRVEAKVTTWSNDAARRLTALSFHLIKLHFDVAHQRAHFRLGGGEAGKLSFHVAGNVVMDGGGTAHVAAQIALGVAGHRVALNLPEVDLVPKSVGGDRFVELLVPLVKGTF